MKKVYISSENKFVYSISEMLKPQLIYIPLKDNELLIKSGDYVYKGDIVAVNKYDKFPLHSSVSGNVTLITKKTNLKGEEEDYIVIENDFKEKYKNRLGYKKDKDIFNYSKEEFIKLLFDMGIIGLSGSGQKTYKKYSASNIKCLVINAMECEPYLYCDKAVLYNYTEQLLECIDAILEIMKIPKAIIAINENDIKNSNHLKKYIGSYPNIKVVSTSGAYPIGWERCLIETVFGMKYKNNPIEIGIIVNNISTMYAIYDALKYNNPLIEKNITISGNGIKKNVNVKVKIGSKLSEIIPYVTEYKNSNNLLFIVGGSMMGKSLVNDDVVVTKNLNSVIIMKNNFFKSSECINCGRCAEVCPVKLFPSLILKNIENIDKLKKLNVKKCIDCGLCSYICPSKIEINEYILLAKKKVSDNDF